MDPELKRELEELRALTKDNHRMLRAIRRDQIFSFIVKVVIWLGIIAIPLFLYQQYVAPRIEEFQGNPTGATLNLFGLPSSSDFQKLINQYKSQ